MRGTLESVEGIGPHYVAALKGIGITTKRRLLLVDLNAEKKLVRVVPGASQLGKWILEAKSLPEMVTVWRQVKAWP